MSDGGDAHSAADRWLPGWLATYLTGLAMGSADAVPGVSGGTIALIAGVYDRLVGAIAAFDPVLLFDAVDERSHRPVVDLLVAMDVRFLALLGLGVATGVATVARVVVFGYRNVPAVTYAFFLGLIAASAYVLLDEVSLSRRREWAAGVAGVVLAFLAAGDFRAAVGQGPLVVFLVGTVSICAMILPGVSGSFVLFVLGLHEYLADQLTTFIDATAGLALGGNGLDAVLSPAVPVVAYCTGAGVGILTFARVVEAALDRDRAATLTFLVALMVGALRLPIREVAQNTQQAMVPVATVTAAALVGAAVVVGLDRATGGVSYGT